MKSQPSNTLNKIPHQFGIVEDLQLLYSNTKKLPSFRMLEEHLALEQQDEQLRYLNLEYQRIHQIKKVNIVLQTIEKFFLDRDMTSEMLSNITKQEHTIIDLIADGIQTKEIANQLCISEHTVQTHRKNINRKLNVCSVTDLVKVSLLLTLLN